MRNHQTNSPMAMAVSILPLQAFGSSQLAGFAFSHVHSLAMQSSCSSPDTVSAHG